MRRFIITGVALMGMCGSALAQSQPASRQPVPYGKTQNPTAQAPQPRPAQATAKEIPPKQFDSPDQAVADLIAAASKNDRAELTAILGSAAQDLLSSGNTGQDAQDRQDFAKLAATKNHIEHSAIDGSAVLLVGDQDWPFPIPLVKTGQKWHFDAELGAEEMLARRIGANELDAIEICQGYVNAQQQYAEQKAAATAPASYAQKIMSSPGGKDGLYPPAGRPALVPEGLAKAAASVPSAERKPYHGYFFRVLKEQGENAPGGAHKYIANGVMIGGFALIAWPAQYGVTGIHTFIVSHDARVFEKDLGAGTANLASQIVSYDPDKSWTLVE